MQTKICSGKYGCGKELPIDNFQYIQYDKILKSGITVYYSYYSKRCKRCNVKASIEGRKIRKQNGTFNIEKHNKCSKECMRRYRLKEKNRIKIKQYKDKISIDLHPVYVRRTLVVMGITNIIPELIEAKRNQLKLYRYAKQCKQTK